MFEYCNFPAVLSADTRWGPALLAPNDHTPLELVPITQPQHTYNTRNTDHIYGKDRKLVCTGHSVVCRGPQIWNKLDDSLRKVRSFSRFKKKIKEQLMSPYETE